MPQGDVRNTAAASAYQGKHLLPRLTYRDRAPLTPALTPADGQRPHLDVIVNGTAVPVPGGLGIDEGRRPFAPLHTHDGSGTVHIESATDVLFTLGQLFPEWGQPLRADRVGPVALTAGIVLRVYRNGQPVNGDPASMRLGAHDETVVWVGPTGQPPHVPASYPFPPGD